MIGPYLLTNTSLQTLSILISQKHLTVSLIPDFYQNFKAYGISGQLLKWFGSFLRGRRQRVKVK